jgi:hypothetical protein
VDRFSLGHPLEGEVLITHHRDVPGVLGRAGRSWDVTPSTSPVCSSVVMVAVVKP